MPQKDSVIGAGDPYCTIVFQFISAEIKPFHIEVSQLLRALPSIPLTFIYTYNLSALHAYTIVGKEIRGIGKDATELEVKITEQLTTIAMKKSKVAIWRLEVRTNHPFFIEDKSRLGIIAVSV